VPTLSFGPQATGTTLDVAVRTCVITLLHIGGLQVQKACDATYMYPASGSSLNIRCRAAVTGFCIVSTSIGMQYPPQQCCVQLPVLAGQL
jgi:hypothetical protein